ncbi:MAG: glycosyltransferase family 39 protein [Anaerolineales bacterium]|nr:glycosyltransferase family 39 protein [Anaerolineales bacterium]
MTGESSSMPLRRTPARIATIFIIVGAFALRLFGLGNQSFWYDEGVSAIIAQRGLGELARWTANDIQPPLYYMMLWGWGRLAGWSEWSLRFLSASAGVVVVALIAILALRLTRRHSAAVLAAVLAAVHPLLLYYSQEARMYMVLLAFGALAAYLLVRAAEGGTGVWVWAVYAGAAVAAAYTHYFAFFMLLGLAIAYCIDVWPRRGRQVWLPWFIANVAVVLLYLPWFSVLLSRLKVDRSYWEGALNLRDALIDIAVGFTSGETVAERTAVWLLVVYAAITLWAIVRLWQSRPAMRRVLIYGSCWLLAPTVAVLLLASNVPKFNVRYVMVALPGLLLLLAGGLTGDGLRRLQSQPKPRWSGAVSLVAVLGLLAGYLLADANWFFDPAFTKDQWRDVAAMLRSRLKSDERVILVSGHAWPIWEYYMPDVEAIRLPALETLDVNAVLDFDESGPALRKAFADETGMRGAWLIAWQDEVVDPNEVAPVQLELSGREKGQPTTFFGVNVLRYGGLRPQRFVDAPPVEHELGVDFGGKVTLQGYKVLNNGDLLLFWERPAGASAPIGDLQFALESFSVSGEPLAHPDDRRLAGYTYPTFRWPEGGSVMGRVPASAWLGPSPQAGPVRFRVQVYDAGNPAAPLATADGKTSLEVGPVEVVID